MTVTEYNHCVDAFADRVFRFAIKNLKDEDMAQDIVQDAYEKLWKKKDDVDFLKARSYLFTTAYHAMVDHWRKQKSTSDLEEVSEVISYQQEMYSGLKPILERALDRLPEIQKSVLLLRDYEGYSYEEIGELCNLNPSQVKVYIYRARMTMKAYLGDLSAVVG